MKSMHSGLLPRASLLVLMLTTLWTPATASAEGNHDTPWGTWYLALEVGPYGLPETLRLPGMMTLHRDGTVLISDGGDFGGLPFNVQDSPQFGAWRYSNGRVRIVTLFLQADPVGDLRSWFRVQLNLRQRNRDVLTGRVNVYQLPCDVPSPFAAFSCPDPVESASDFVSDGVPDVPVKFRRLRARFISPD